MATLNKLFISHSHRDQPLAAAFKGTLSQIFKNVEVTFSSDKEIGGGPQGGTNWLDWIKRQLVDCEEALLLLTPYSIQKPWPMWEAGAVSGLALADPGAQLQKFVTPISFGIPKDALPGPFVVTQAFDGMRQDQLEKVFSDLMNRRADYPPAVLKAVLAQHIPALMGEVKAWFANASALVSEASVVEWCTRIERLRSQGRSADVGHLHRWMRLMYDGPRAAESDALAWNQHVQEHAWDLRLHLRLGESYAESEQYEQAIQQYRLAGELAPLDVFVLHGLALSQIAHKQLNAGRKTIDRILELDPEASEWNPEVAGLEGRYWKEMAKQAESRSEQENARKHYGRAREAYNKGLNKTSSFYMADNVGQISLKLGDLEAARSAFKHVDEIVEQEKANLWNLASGANAALVLGDEERALTRLRRVHEFAPTEQNLSSIEGGLETVRKALGKTTDDYARWRAALRP